VSFPSRISIVVAGCAFALAAAAPAAAQDVDTMPMPVVEASLGYVFMGHETSDDAERYPRGWHVGMAWNATPWFSVVGEAGGSYRSATTTYVNGSSITLNERKREVGFLAGPRVYHKVKRVVPFAQFLTGMAVRRHEQASTMTGSLNAHWNSDTQANLLALQPGGGVGVLLTERLGVRAALDYRALFDISEDMILHEFRVVTGFTIHWGGR
jgi:hypothetical protein